MCVGGGQGLEYGGGRTKGGPNSQQARRHIDVVLTSLQRNDVASTSV